MTPEAQERFWSKVDRRAASECWPWRGHINNYGYGVFHFRGKRLVASRVSYELANGRNLGQFHACHHCDTPNCVNPNHLFAGTAKDNAADREAKGRGRRRIEGLCVAGLHPWTPENKYAAGKYQRCKHCHIEAGKRRRARLAKAKEALA